MPAPPPSPDSSPAPPSPKKGWSAAYLPPPRIRSQGMVLASGSEAQGWHLNVHYSRSLTELAAFSPVLLSAGGAAGRKFAVAAVWWVRELPAAGPGASGGVPHVGQREQEPLGRWWAGGAQGDGGGGLFFFKQPPWRAHFARFSRVRAAMRTAPGARKVGPDDTDELRELAVTRFPVVPSAQTGTRLGMRRGWCGAAKALSSLAPLARRVMDAGRATGRATGRAPGRASGCSGVGGVRLKHSPRSLRSLVE
eukprot:gene9561-biopygen19741